MESLQEATGLIFTISNGLTQVLPADVTLTMEIYAAYSMERQPMTLAQLLQQFPDNLQSVMQRHVRLLLLLRHMRETRPLQLLYLRPTQR